jgi:hypothetical protein
VLQIRDLRPLPSNLRLLPGNSALQPVIFRLEARDRSCKSRNHGAQFHRIGLKQADFPVLRLDLDKGYLVDGFRARKPEIASESSVKENSVLNCFRSDVCAVVMSGRVLLIAARNSWKDSSDAIERTTYGLIRRDGSSVKISHFVTSDFGATSNRCPWKTSACLAVQRGREKVK